MDKSQFCLILGMHRSGTSCLAGALERCGVYLGNVKRKGKYNKKGYFEIEEVYKIHDQILGMNKTTWFQFDSQNQVIQVHPYHQQLLKQILQELENHPFAGLKDPRLLLLLDFWEKMTDNPSVFIGTFRHPMAVAHSLANRDGFSIEQGLQLWKKYNTILVEKHQKNPFPIIHYDLENAVDYLKNILYLADLLNLRPQKRRLRRFITPKLEHHQFDKTQIPLECKKLYDYLLKIQLQYDK